MLLTKGKTSPTLSSSRSSSVVFVSFSCLNIPICLQALPVFTFANQAGLDMLETTLVALQDMTLEKIFNDDGKKTLFAELPQIMQQVKKKNTLNFLKISRTFLDAFVLAFPVSSKLPRP